MTNLKCTIAMMIFATLSIHSLGVCEDNLLQGNKIYAVQSNEEHPLISKFDKSFLTTTGERSKPDKQRVINRVIASIMVAAIAGGFIAFAVQN